jgi:hypothetical protein
LRHLVLDSEFRARITESVCAHAESHFSPKTYAEQLVAFASEPRATGGLLGRIDAEAARLRTTPTSRLRAYVAQVAVELAGSMADPA